MNRIIVGVDESVGARPAIDWAIKHATEHDTLVFVHAWHLYPAGGFDIYPYLDDVAAAASRATETLANDYRQTSGLTIEVIVEQGHTGSRLIHAAKDADLLVVGRRGLGGVRGLLLGSVSTYVVHHGQCPIVVVTAPTDD